MGTSEGEAFPFLPPCPADPVSICHAETRLRRGAVRPWIFQHQKPVFLDDLKWRLPLAAGGRRGAGGGSIWQDSKRTSIIHIPVFQSAPRTAAVYLRLLTNKVGGTEASFVPRQTTPPGRLHSQHKTRKSSALHRGRRNTPTNVYSWRGASRRGKGKVKKEKEKEKEPLSIILHSLKIPAPIASPNSPQEWRSCRRVCGKARKNDSAGGEKIQRGENRIGKEKQAGGGIQVREKKINKR